MLNWRKKRKRMNNTQKLTSLMVLFILVINVIYYNFQSELFDARKKQIMSTTLDVVGTTYELEQAQLKNSETNINRYLETNTKGAAEFIEDLKKIPTDEQLERVRSEYALTGIWLIEDDGRIFEGTTETDRRVTSFFSKNFNPDWLNQFERLKNTPGAIWISPFASSHSKGHDGYMKYGYSSITLGKKTIIVETGISAETLKLRTYDGKAFVERHEFGSYVVDVKFNYDYEKTSTNDKIDIGPRPAIGKTIVKDLGGQTEVTVKILFERTEAIERSILIVTILSSVGVLVLYFFILSAAKTFSYRETVRKAYENEREESIMKDE